MKKKVAKCIAFVLIGVILFGMLQFVLVQKFDYPVNTDGMTRGIRGLYAEEEESIDVILLGTSHIEVGVSPMTMYENYGITAYNLGTSKQPMGVSYSLLKETLKTQSPKVVMIDASNFYLGDIDDYAPWRYVIDSMPFSMNKLELMKIYRESVENADSMASMLFPIAKYHTRWKELVDNDYAWSSYQNTYYTKGYTLRSQLEAYETTVEEMNEINENSEKKQSISESNLAWLDKIQKLCEEENIELLVTKIPAIYDPTEYASAWTKEESEELKGICAKKDIKFWDILYDAKMEIDYQIDSMDGGKHFNLNGVEKASKLIGEYLVDNYGLESRQVDSYDKDLLIYQKTRELAEIQLAQTCADYLEKLNKNREDYVIVMAAAKNFPMNMTQEDKQAFYDFGISCSLEDIDETSYIALFDGGTLMWEVMDSNQVLHEYTDESLNQYSISSECSTSEVSVMINGEEHTQAKDGINIVVFDKKTQSVVDVVSFNPWKEEYVADRTNKVTENLLKGYEDYFIKNK